MSTLRPADGDSKGPTDAFYASFSPIHPNGRIAFNHNGLSWGLICFRCGTTIFGSGLTMVDCFFCRLSHLVDHNARRVTVFYGEDGEETHVFYAD